MMSENPRTFALKILFDREQINREKLEEQARKVLREYLAVELFPTCNRLQVMVNMQFGGLPIAVLLDNQWMYYIDFVFLGLLRRM
jgi:hypothetical protein